MLSPEIIAELRRLEFEHAIGPLEEGECVRCHNSMSIDSGDEPTPFCHPCAQEAIAIVFRSLAALLDEREQLVRIATAADNYRAAVLTRVISNAVSAEWPLRNALNAYFDPTVNKEIK